MSSEPTSAPPPAPAKTNPWVIAAAVAVVLCCGCFGVVGLLLAFGGDILEELGLAASLLIQAFQFY